MRVVAALAAALCAGLLAAPADAAKRSWAEPQIREVVAAGLLAPSVAAFRPEQPLTAGALAEAFLVLEGRFVRTAPFDYAPLVSDRPVTIRELNGALVGFMGLGDTARTFAAELRAGGLAPRQGAGTETIARLLGLRYNHPHGSDSLELGPRDVATRAEAAYSLARVLRLSVGDLETVRRDVATFVLPPLTDWQRRIVDRAVSFVGYPYVWGGTSELRQRPLGQAVPGGFDCSGFIWRVFKLEPFDGASALSTVLRGRTTASLAGEVGPARRIRNPANVQPGDVIFQGSRGAHSQPSEVGHAGIYLGGGWFVHSSRYGTTLHPFDGWYREQFAWARRPLREAGLA